MNKAKIMLSAIAILGLVGGVFAFKAAKFGTGTAIFSYQTTVAGQLTTLCTRNPNFVVTNAAVAPISTYFTTTLANSICPTTFFTGHVTTALIPGN